jgi:hypothetical protein
VWILVLGWFESVFASDFPKIKDDWFLIKIKNLEKSVKFFVKQFFRACAYELRAFNPVTSESVQSLRRG